MKQKMKIFYTLYLLAVISWTGTAFAQTEILQSDETSAVISYSPEGFELIANGDETVRPHLNNCGLEGDPGQPQILYLPVALGVPPRASVRLAVISSDFTEYKDVDLAPVGSLEDTETPGLGRCSYRKSPDYYNKAGLYPSQLVKLEGLNTVRQFNVADIKIYPLQYDPVAKILRVYKKITFKAAWAAANWQSSVHVDPAFEPIFEKKIINYSVAKNWALPSPKSKYIDPFAGSSVWYKLPIISQGLYRLDYNYLKRNGIDPDVIDPRTIKIFSGYHNALPRDYNTPVPDTMKQLAILFEGQQDGRFDPGDYLIFYGQRLSGWDKNSYLSNGLFHNPYSDTNCYWLCWGGQQGLRMASKDGSPFNSNYVSPASFDDTLHFEYDVFNPFNSGELWYWSDLKRLASEQYKDYSFELFVPDPAQTQAVCRINLRPGISSRHHVVWGLNGSLLNDSVWSADPITGPFDGIDAVQLNADQPNNRLGIRLDRTSADTSDVIYFNWAEIYYRRRYRAWNYNLRFRSDSVPGGICRFKITGLANDSVVIFDISDPCRPVNVLSNTIYPAYTEFEDTWERDKVYWIASSPGWLKPLRIEPYVPQNIGERYLNTNYLIIAADEFWTQAQKMIEIHAADSRLQPSAAVKLSWVYNEFSFGVKDPAAIRNFLKRIYLDSGRKCPGWCVLFGDGSFDYKEIDQTSGKHNYIPSYQAGALYWELGEYLFRSYDDWYAYFEHTAYPQVILGRIPAKTKIEAEAFLNKLTAYKTLSDIGPWRNRAVLMADDDRVPRSTSIETEHVTYSEILYKDLIPANYDVAKIYGTMSIYPLDADSHRPDARTALNNAWNEGVGLINYFGHGAYWVWGHEWYFRDSDVSNLVNGVKLPLVVMGSCGTSRYDNNKYESIGTSLVVKANGGAMATIGATRGTWAPNNLSLVSEFYEGLFDTLDMGQALLQSKIHSINPLYVLMGDPAMFLARPSGQCSLSISSDTLVSRARHVINGRYYGFAKPFAGSSVITLFDIPTRDSILRYPTVKYEIPGKPIVKLSLTTNNDAFSTSFIMPNLASIRPETLANARLSVYAWGSEGDASGVFGDSIWIGGIDTLLKDSVNPLISFWINGSEVQNGDIVTSTAKLTVKIQDSSGVNIVPNSTRSQDQIRLIIDGDQLYDVSSGFIYDVNSCTSGTTSYVFGNLKEGSHNLKVTAYDCFGNKGTLERVIKYVSADVNKIDNVYNYPNPCRTETFFTFTLYRDSDVAIKIYTLSGKLIKELVAPALKYGYNQVYWNGRDNDNNNISNGVYFYKIKATNDGGETSAVGKLAVIK